MMDCLSVPVPLLICNETVNCMFCSELIVGNGLRPEKIIIGPKMSNKMRITEHHPRKNFTTLEIISPGLF